MRKLLIAIALVLSALASEAQKKPLDIDALISWQVIKEKYISNDGQWVVVYSEPYRGDSRLIIASADGKFYKEFISGYKPQLSPDNNFIVFRIKPGYQQLRKLKLEGKKKSELPKDSAYIFFTDSRQVARFDSIYQVLVPHLKGKNLALLRYYKAKKTPKFYRLIIPHDGQKTIYIDSVSEAVFSDNGNRLAFIKIHGDSTGKAYVVRVYDFNKNSFRTIATYQGKTKKLTLSTDGQLLAYLNTQDTTKTKVYALYLFDLKKNRWIKNIDTLTSDIPQGWAVSENGKIFFSRDGKRLFFGIAPVARQEGKDTIPEDEKVKLDLWSWTDSLLMPAQLKRLDKDKKFSYTTVYDIAKDKVIRLQTNRYTNIKLFGHGDGRYALERDPSPYLKQQSWDYPWWADFYIIDLRDGSKTLAARKVADGYMSADGKFFVYYNYQDSTWYCFDREKNITHRLTDNSTVKFYNEENDVPAPADPYGFGGFSQDGGLCFVYDKYDIWAVDPSGRRKPYKLTGSQGRQNNLQLRMVDLNKDDDYVTLDDLIIKAFNKKTKDAGFYKIASFAPGSALTLLVMSSNYYSDPIKAKDAGQLIWQRSDVHTYPDVWTSGKNFEKATELTHFIDQQKPYIWANVELVHWITTDGRDEQGLLFKPDNFDPNKKYPMIVYYYELYSDMLNRYFMPRPSRSIINPIHYASNGYLVFIPNIRYKVGFPGMSAYNYVVSGTLSLLERYPWIDRHHLGLQGQSWGGYETAFIITQTRLFAAAEAGAPVSNMTSAYGGIRWGSGLSRMFQYEKTQSRIGKNLWNGLPLYLYNSPVFYAPYIETPLLIMHNDNDGAVPWYQGIEFFVALRRLSKPVWLMNYNGEPHNLREKSPASVDLTHRMMQFFDHYLKDAPMPEWMKHGRPAIEKH